MQNIIYYKYSSNAVTSFLQNLKCLLEILTSVLSWQEYWISVIDETNVKTLPERSSSDFYCERHRKWSLTCGSYLEVAFNSGMVITNVWTTTCVNVRCTSLLLNSGVVSKVLPAHLLCFYCVVYTLTPEAAGPDGSARGHGCGLDRLQLRCCGVSWRSDGLCESRWETRLTGFDVSLISNN